MSTTKRYDASQIQVLKGLEAVRMRPGMYVGGTKLSGFINYLLAPFELLLQSDPRRIEFVVDNDGYHLYADTALASTLVEDGPIAHEIECMALAALSESLFIQVYSREETLSVQYERGEQVYFHRQATSNFSKNTRIDFKPDSTIFEVTSVDRGFLNSYFERLCHFYPAVEFKLLANNAISFHTAKNGIQHLFNAYSKPFQIMHQPIYIETNRAGVHFEMVFAYHNLSENQLITYVNRSLIKEDYDYDKSTCQTGLMEGIDTLSKTLISKKIDNGVIGVVSITHNELQYGSSLDINYIDNPELHPFAKEFVVDHTQRWMRKHPETASELEKIETMRFI